ncbi:hypothetical protein L6R29_18795 [Myxococcota bacterium]|nr:hypothetical protein [Myxococcota bacterium]
MIKRVWSAYVGAFLGVVLFWGMACESPEPKKEDPKPIDPNTRGLLQICPGAKGCLRSEGALKASAVAVKISPENYEIARWSYFQERDFCPEPVVKDRFGIKRCQQLKRGAMDSRKDCGHDGLCAGDNWKTEATCSSTQACPAGLVCREQEGRCYAEYSKPDEDGSEGDGQPDWFVDCGRDGVCPCIDLQGQPAYFGADKKTCLKGHKANPDYKGADADGSEGNGEFEGIWMGGFQSNHPLQGVHDDIWARVVVLQTGETTVAIVSLDLVGFFYDGVKAIRKRVQEALGEGAIDYILISSTHNHEGPDTMGNWGPGTSIPVRSGVVAFYYEQVLQKTSQAIQQAYTQLAPAKMRVAQLRTGVDGLNNDIRDPFIIDDTMTVAQWTATENNKPIATLVNWGSHPEVLFLSNNYLTSDFPHYLREGLEQGVFGAGKKALSPAQGGVAVYLQAAVGGLMTPLGVEVPDLDGTLRKQDDWDKARALGSRLAIKTTEALKQAAPVETASIRLWSREVRLPVDNTVFLLAFAGGLIQREIYDYDKSKSIGPNNPGKVQTEIAVIRIGGLSFYSMPGEVDPELLVGGFDGAYSFGKPLVGSKNENPPNLSKAPKGPFLKEKIPGEYKIMVGLGNDALGYILGEWNFVLADSPYFNGAKGDHYEETNSLGPKTAPLLLEAYDALLKEVERKDP